MAMYSRSKQNVIKGIARQIGAKAQSKSFKPCRGCPNPKECARAGRCKAKTRMK